MTTREKNTVGDWGLKVFILGIVLTFIGAIVSAVGAATEPVQPPNTQPQSSFGGVIFIGPFPIVFGSGPQGSTLLLIGLVILALMIFLGFATFRRREF